MASSTAVRLAFEMDVQTAALMVCRLVGPMVDSKEQQMAGEKAAPTAAKRVAPMAILKAG